jgi:hypothetical protein
LRPQQRIDPVESSAQVWFQLAAICVTRPPALTLPADIGVSLSPMRFVLP